MKSVRDDQALGQLIRAATMSDDVQGGAVITSGGLGDVQAKVVVLPIGPDEQRRLDDFEARAVVVIADHDQQRALAPQVLENSYGLTAAEVRIAMGMAAGQTHEELSKALFVSVPTVKTHARHIFQKMHIHRQADLVRLVYGLPALV